MPKQMMMGEPWTAAGVTYLHIQDKKEIEIPSGYKLFSYTRYYHPAKVKTHGRVAVRGGLIEFETLLNHWNRLSPLWQFTRD